MSVKEKMTKVVYNACYGGFSLSPEAEALYIDRKFNGEKPKNFYNRDVGRGDQVLVQIVEELGAKADGYCARLRIAEVPYGSKYRIDEYDGFESVETPDSYEWVIAE